MSFVTGDAINHRAYNLVPAESAPAPSGDPYWTDVTALLNFVWQGVDTVTLDSSNYNRTVNGGGGSFITDANFVTGWPAGYSSANQPFSFSYVRPAILDAFTVEMWSEWAIPIACTPLVLTNGLVTPLGVFYDDGTGVLSITATDSLGTIFSGFSASTLPVNWFHLAIVLNAGVLTCYVDGAVFLTFALVNGMHSSTVAECYPAKVSVDGFEMDLGALRITEHVARYTAPFTPPTAPFPIG